MARCVEVSICSCFERSSRGKLTFQNQRIALPADLSTIDRCEHVHQMASVRSRDSLLPQLELQHMSEASGMFHTLRNPILITVLAQPATHSSFDWRSCATRELQSRSRNFSINAR